ncbi:MAG TPA: hypothetical protein VMV20_01190 [Chitinophagaceae bacterium]|nr:hypothetical protein [Chitinophagaceae bacterium]
MNNKLIFLLSLFGLAMAFATISAISSRVEPYFWLVIFIICAWIIARNCTGNFFLHGFWVGILNCVWILIVHSIWYRTYMVNHPAMVKMASWPFPGHSRRDMLVIGPIIGVISALVQGFFAWVASQLVKPTPTPKAA